MKRKVYCSAVVNYALSEDEREARTVVIHDARANTSLNWQENGFALLHHDCEVVDWDNHAIVKQAYYPEMEALARQITGARAAIISAHINRNPEAAAKHSDYGPIHFVHSDFGDDYGEFLKAYYQEDDVHAKAALDRHGLNKSDIANASRIMIIQFWRNVGAPAMRTPLAVCDCNSVPRSDLLQYKLPGYGGNGRPFDAFVVKSSADDSHIWYTYPDMLNNEILVIRTFDSDRIPTGQPYWTPHSAIEDPTRKNAAERRSVEVRAMCIFGAS
jgi:hypothetical protein